MVANHVCSARRSFPLDHLTLVISKGTAAQPQISVIGLRVYSNRLDILAHGAADVCGAGDPQAAYLLLTVESLR